MSTYCLKGRELLLDLQRSDFLHPWDEESLRIISSEINLIFNTKMITDHTILAEDEEGSKVNNAYFGNCAMRDKRYLLW